MVFLDSKEVRAILVAEKTICRTADSYKGKLKSVEDCAESCKNISPMFIYGRNDAPYRQWCYCELKAKPDGTCLDGSDYRYDLYKYGEGENFDIK